MTIGPENWCWVDHVLALRRERLGLADREAYQAEDQAAQDTYATDAGDVCGVCGDPVDWADHSPPVEPGGFVRCYAGCAQFMPSNVYPLKTRGGH